MSVATPCRIAVAIAVLLAVRTGVASGAPSPAKPKVPKERKAWIDGKGMCVFPFATDGLPTNADDFAAAMARGYRRGLKLPEAGAPIVVAAGGRYPSVESLKIDVRDAVIDPDNKGRKPSDRQFALYGLDAAHFELLGQGMSVEKATVNVGMTASDATLLFTRDKDGKPLLVLGNAREGRLTFDMSMADVERVLLSAARKGGKAYGLSVDRTRLQMSVENGRTIRVHLKLFTRLGFIPAGLHFRARLDIDDNLDGRLSELSCSGDEVLGPLIGGLIQPFLARYNGKTRPLMTFPKTDMRLRDVSIVADQSFRLTADFGS